MANVALFRINLEPQYFESVNTPDYVNDTDAIINPDLSGVTGIPTKYWKRSGNNVVEMTQAEKNAVLANELLIKKNAADSFTSEPLAIFTALIKVINLRLPSGQKITKAEMVSAIKEEIA